MNTKKRGRPVVKGIIKTVTKSTENVTNAQELTQEKKDEIIENINYQPFQKKKKQTDLNVTKNGIVIASGRFVRGSGKGDCNICNKK